MKFDMGRAWNDAVGLLRANQQVVLIVAGVFFFLPSLALVMVMPDYAQSITPTAAETDPNAALEALTTAYRQVWWALLIAIVAQGIGMLGLLALLTDRDRPTVGEALVIGAKSFLPYVATSLLQTIAIVIVVLIPFVVGGAAGIAAGLVVGLVAAAALAYLFTKFSMSIVVIVAERVMNPLAAISRSWALTKGNSLRLFLFYVLLFVCLLIISIVLGIVMGLLGALAGPDGVLFVSGLSNALINMIFLAIYLAVLAAVHRQLSGSAMTVGETFE